MALKISEIISIVLFSLVTGVFWGPWLGLSRSIATFEPEVFLAIGHRMIRNFAVVMPLLMPAAGLSIIAVLITSFEVRPETFYVSAAAFAFFLAALIITLAVEVPIDNRIKTWTIATLPANWTKLRDRWEAFHLLRTFASVTGLALLVIGVVL